MTIVPYTRQPDRIPRADRLQETAELANQIAGTDFVPTNLRNNPAAITAAILYGDEVGVGPMQSLARIAVINGRPTLAAETQRALILAAGHDLWVEESTISKCTVAGRRRDSDATSRITWTLDDARRAGLAGKPPWKNYPRQMLLARASAELARSVFPDAIGGLAASEEAEDGTDVDNGAAPASTLAPKQRQRKRASVSAPATTPEQTPPPEPELPPLPGEEQPDEPRMISGPQRRKLQALFREKKIEERAERLSYASAVIGRQLDTSTDLTLDEASQVIEQLERYDSGELNVDAADAIDPPVSTSEVTPLDMLVATYGRDQVETAYRHLWPQRDKSPLAEDEVSLLADQLAHVEVGSWDYPEATA